MKRIDIKNSVWVPVLIAALLFLWGGDARAAIDGVSGTTFNLVAKQDHIATSDNRWRYVKAVKTDVQYGSQDNKKDRPTLQRYQNIIMNGGVCGRRAFFGRFILRSFGIPTTARPQRGHATLVHWTSDGWVICLGATWGWGWTSYGQDIDFVLHTQARKVERSFPQVLRAQWAGAAAGEKRAFGFHAGATGFWNGKRNMASP